MAAGHATITSKYSDISQEKWDKIFGKGKKAESGTYVMDRNTKKFVKVSGDAKMPDRDLGQVPPDYDPANPQPFFDGSLNRRCENVQERKRWMNRNDYFFGK